jgi:sporulation protein YlmC with PRC-barrel domain
MTVKGLGLFEVDDIRDWVGQAVVDNDGAKIGNLESVYFDTATDEPSFAAVKVGFPGGGRLVFVPLVGARVAPKHIRVMTDKKTAKAAPAIETDGQLDSSTEPTIYAHYSMPYTTGATGERRLGRR